MAPPIVMPPALVPSPARCAADSAILIEDPPQIHFQRRVCDLEDPAFELAEAFGFGDSVGALEIGVQKPDLGNTLSDIIVATFLNLGETLVTDDLDVQERRSRRWLLAGSRRPWAFGPSENAPDSTRA